jgi:hypothetical protein
VRAFGARVTPACASEVQNLIGCSAVVVFSVENDKCPAIDGGGTKGVPGKADAGPRRAQKSAAPAFAGQGRAFLKGSAA